MVRAVVVVQHDPMGYQQGTGPAAAIEGYQISGKTGTAQQINPACEYYFDNAYWITFAGMATTDDPRYVIGVMMDNPERNSDGTQGPTDRPRLRQRLGPGDVSFEAKGFRHVAVAIPKAGVSPGVTASARQQSVQSQQPDVVHGETTVGRCIGQSLSRGFGFGHVTVGPPVEQCLHKDTRGWNAPGPQLSLAGQIIDGGAHERYGAVEISTPGSFPRQVGVDNRQLAEIVSAAQELVADLGQQFLSAIALGSGSAVHQRNTQRHPGEGQRQVITGSFGNPHGGLDLTQRRIVGY